MKKLNLFVLLIAAFSIISCGDDDGGSGAALEITEENLVGTWQWTSSTIDGEAYELDDCQKQDTSTYSITSTGENIAVFTEHYLEDGDCISSESNEYTWSLTDTVLSEIFGLADSRLYTITELTDTTLKLRSDDFYMENGETKTEVYIDTYTRQ